MSDAECDRSRGESSPPCGRLCGLRAVRPFREGGGDEYGRCSCRTRSQNTLSRKEGTLLSIHRPIRCGRPPTNMLVAPSFDGLPAFECAPTTWESFGHRTRCPNCQVLDIECPLQPEHVPFHPALGHVCHALNSAPSAPNAHGPRNTRGERGLA